MALIKCPGCGKEVSDKAIACPSCGHPIGKEKINNKKIEVELTNKKWKSFGLAGLVMTFLGLFSLANHQAGLGVIFFVFGFIIVIIYRFGRWWNNG